MSVATSASRRVPRPTYAMGRTKAMDPRLLDAFIEPRSSNLSRGSKGRSKMSWDGLSVDPRPFSKLDARPLPGDGRRGEPTRAARVDVAGTAWMVRGFDTAIVSLSRAAPRTIRVVIAASTRPRPPR